MNQRRFRAIAAFIAIAILAVLLLIFLVRTAGQSKGCFQPEEAPLFSVPTKSPNVVSFLALGDTGEASKMQSDNFAAATKICESLDCDFALLLGDNFYEKGIDRATKKHLDRVYGDQLQSLGLPLYATLGNHDVKKSFQAQIDLSRLEPLWNMPQIFRWKRSSINRLISKRNTLTSRYPIR